VYFTIKGSVETSGEALKNFSTDLGPHPFYQWKNLQVGEIVILWHCSQSYLTFDVTTTTPKRLLLVISKNKVMSLDNNTTFHVTSSVFIPYNPLVKSFSASTVCFMKLDDALPHYF
jgi:hypothetical protein